VRLIQWLIRRWRYMAVVVSSPHMIHRIQILTPIRIPLMGIAKLSFDWIVLSLVTLDT
jgi:hypothetical protein